ncbi:hypothetical protein M0638_28490 [Roseomonas sp. NAR14]|uniref:LydA family holin superfamily III n=1 Tax=Roseomonas acroporae TaxID=2937791 RepID=A0A9X2C0M2_9PROT|nr:phage holin family protein [Roseomonas acroporae]MCK8788295.1 hypothetical protein [Roseomonas acroporae]
MDDPWFKGILGAAVGAALLGVLGRLLAYHSAQTRPLGWSLLWELPVAIGMGLIGRGVADILALHDFPAYACTIAVAYVGPRCIDLAVAWLQSRMT